MKGIFLKIVGVFCLAAGVVGLVLPVLPGWLFIFLGISLIAPKEAARIERFLVRRLLKREFLRANGLDRRKFEAGFTTRHLPVILTKTADLLDPEVQKKLLTAFREHGLLPGTGSGPFVFLGQVHADRIAVLRQETGRGQDAFVRLPETDAVLTDIPGLTLIVMTADCLPVFLTTNGPDGRLWAGLVHAGWRGTRDGIVRKTVERLCSESGASPSSVRVFFGPAICRIHYEVGAEFEKIFPAAGVGHSPVRCQNGRFYFNLPGTNRDQLLRAGVRRERIIDSRICPFRENRTFYSYRREKENAGRNLSFIRIKRNNS